MWLDYQLSLVQRSNHMGLIGKVAIPQTHCKVRMAGWSSPLNWQLLSTTVLLTSPQMACPIFIREKVDQQKYQLQHSTTQELTCGSAESCEGYLGAPPLGHLNLHIRIRGPLHWDTLTCTLEAPSTGTP